ncbi:MAG: amino acid ABC transporter permease [Oscillospiraceae bacterium]|nr:amino acid ABC transporter permease [Oscillospiraceae bacterium]
MFVRGTWITLVVSVIGTLAGFLLGYAVGMIEDSQISREDHFLKRGILSILKAIAKVYVELFRGTPMIVQAMIVFYGLRQSGLEIDSISAGILVTLLNTGAYMSETVRAGIKSIDPGQREGALALGMSPVSTMFHIILPQAFKNIVPEMANMFLTNLKMTSVLNVIGVQELFLQAKTAGGTYYKYLESYLVIAAIYLVLCFVFSRIFTLVEKKMAGQKDYVLAIEYMENTQ